MLNESEKKTKTGDLGEKLVAKYFRGLGYDVEESLDLFDRKKDMMINEETCEVKTQQPWHSENAFSVKENQMKKCLSVDHLIFVETPSENNNYEVKLYEFPKDKRQTKIRTTSDNRKMYLFSKVNGNLLTSISEPVIVEQFKKYMMSAWRKR